MIKYKVQMTDVAKRDLKDISSYIAKELMEPEIAKDFIKSAKEVILGLSEMPQRCTLVNDENLAAQGIRMCLIKNYVAFYVISDDDKTVNVVRILYKRRDWANLI